MANYKICPLTVSENKKRGDPEMLQSSKDIALNSRFRKINYEKKKLRN